MAAVLAVLLVAGWKVTARVPLGSDLGMYFAPDYEYAQRRVREGELPLWNPFEFCGVPFLAAIQPAVLYPPVRVIYAIFSADVAPMALFFFHVGVSALGTLALAQQMGLTLWPAVFAATWPVLPGWLIRSYDHPVFPAGISWLPLLLLLFRRLVVRADGRSAALLALVQSLQVLSGYPPITFASAYLLVLSLPFWIWEARQRHVAVSGRRLLGTVCLSGTLAFAIAAAEVLPASELLARSARSTAVAHARATLGEVNRYLPELAYVLGVRDLPLESRLVNLWKDFGPLGLGLCAVAVLAFWRRPAVLYFAAAAIVCSLVPFGALQRLPLFGLVRYGFEWTYSTHLFLYLLAAHTLQAMQRRVAGWRWRGAAAVGLVFAMTAWSWTRIPWMWVVPNILTPPTLPEEIHRVCDLGLGHGRIYWPSGPARATLFRAQIPSVSGYEPLLPARNKRLNDIMGIPNGWGGEADWLRRLADHKEIASRMNIQCVISGSPQPELEAAGFVRAATVGRSLVIYRNHDALPEARVVSSARWVSSGEEALALLQDGGVVASRQVILEGRGYNLPPCGTPSASEARITHYSPEALRIHVSTSCPGFLVLSQSDSPGWEVTVDGERAPMFTADYLFRAVPVPAGRSEVAVRYRPLSLEVGQYLSVAGFSVALGFLIPWKWRRRAPE